MAKQEYSQYQKGVIAGYYDNLDTIMLHKLSELVSELYMAHAPRPSSLEPGDEAGGTQDEGRRKAKIHRLWQRVHKAMIQMKIPPAIIDHIMQQRDVQILAKNLQDWLARAGRK